ncbi:atp-dependent rna helicase [Holotrichia oblita]|uniref:Atp-dependent rna helicase n=1 Tax=Holotrichia oblita TaxID=644536 RepID=A0ACB9SPV6_HOLOL|nr:atp-dependent rna helicase [Holotrichia oblita]
MYIDDLQFKHKFSNIVTGKIDEKLEFAATIKGDPHLDALYYEQFLESKRDLKYGLMMKKRMKLPAFEMRDEIINLIENNQICVISGETGCGKTTQVAQFILDDYLTKQKGSTCRIVCTQPRRISAISIAMRVAEERAEKLGNSVGYQIRLEKELPRVKGSITFCTTGVILKQMESDPSLDGVSHLILDEIHERDIMSDFIISLMKTVITKRKDLKLILMSATLNSDKFSKYYDNCPKLEIPGFTYHVEEYYLEDAIKHTGFEFSLPLNKFREKQNPKFHFMKRNYDKRHAEYMRQFGPYLRKLRYDKRYTLDVIQQLENPNCEELSYDLIVDLIIYICHKMKEAGAILVFLTGYSEISQLHNLLQFHRNFNVQDYLILPLHSQMPTVDQRQIFEPPPPGIKRKIILSTNIAETSITIDDVVYVIDCGKHKMKKYCPETNNQTLLSEWVTLANAKQRKGRAGRVKPGICYHLYHRGREQFLDSYPLPEILRTRLEDVILMIKLLQLGPAMEFLQTLLDKPSEKTVEVSIELLKRMNALDEEENLTPLGFHLARLPVHPQIGKMLLLGSIFSCLDPILSIAASLDYKDAFQLPLGKTEAAELKKDQLANDCKSDHILSHIALTRFEECVTQFQAKSFCWEYFLSYYTLVLQQNMKKQFMLYLRDMNFVTDTDPKARDDEEFEELVIHPDHKRVQLHKKSILVTEGVYESPFLVYYLRLKSTSDFIHDATMVHPLPLIFFGDQYAQHIDNGVTSISVNRCLKFKCSEATMMLISELKKQMDWFLEYKISNPGLVDWTTDTPDVKVLIAVMELITNEDTGEIDLSAYDDYDDNTV